MIWFNIGKLESRIGSDELTEKDGFYYLLAGVICSSFIIPEMKNSLSMWCYVVYGVCCLLFNLWGVFKMFRINNSIDGKDFLKRFLSIRWVICIRLLVLFPFFLIASIIPIIAMERAFKLDHDSTVVSKVIVLIILIIFAFFQNNNSINSIKRIKKLIEKNPA